MHLRTLSPFRRANEAPIYESAGHSVNCENCDRLKRCLRRGGLRGSRDRPPTRIPHCGGRSSIPRDDRSVAARTEDCVIPKSGAGTSTADALRHTGKRNGIRLQSVGHAMNRWPGRYASLTSRTIQLTPASSKACARASSAFSVCTRIVRDRGLPLSWSRTRQTGPTVVLGAAAPAGWETAGGGEGAAESGRPTRVLL